MSPVKVKRQIRPKKTGQTSLSVANTSKCCCNCCGKTPPPPNPCQTCSKCSTWPINWSYTVSGFSSGIAVGCACGCAADYNGNWKLSISANSNNACCGSCSQCRSFPCKWQVNGTGFGGGTCVSGQYVGCGPWNQTWILTSSQQGDCFWLTGNSTGPNLSLAYSSSQNLMRLTFYFSPPSCQVTYTIPMTQFLCCGKNDLALESVHGGCGSFPDTITITSKDCQCSGSGGDCLWTQTKNVSDGNQVTSILTFSGGNWKIFFQANANDCVFVYTLVGSQFLCCSNNTFTFTSGPAGLTYPSTITITAGDCVCGTPIAACQPCAQLYPFWPSEWTLVGSGLNASSCVNDSSLDSCERNIFNNTFTLTATDDGFAGQTCLFKYDKITTCGSPSTCANCPNCPQFPNVGWTLTLSGITAGTDPQEKCTQLNGTWNLKYPNTFYQELPSRLCQGGFPGPRTITSNVCVWDNGPASSQPYIAVFFDPNAQGFSVWIFPVWIDPITGNPGCTHGVMEYFLTQTPGNPGYVAWQCCNSNTIPKNFTTSTCGGIPTQVTLTPTDCNCSLVCGGCQRCVTFPQIWELFLNTNIATECGDNNCNSDGPGGGGPGYFFLFKQSDNCHWRQQVSQCSAVEAWDLSLQGATWMLTFKTITCGTLIWSLPDSQFTCCGPNVFTSIRNGNAFLRPSPPAWRVNNPNTCTCKCICGDCPLLAQYPCNFSVIASGFQSHLSGCQFCTGFNGTFTLTPCNVNCQWTDCGIDQHVYLFRGEGTGPGCGNLTGKWAVLFFLQGCGPRLYYTIPVAQFDPSQTMTFSYDQGLNGNCYCDSCPQTITVAAIQHLDCRSSGCPGVALPATLHALFGQNTRTLTWCSLSGEWGDQQAPCGCWTNFELIPSAGGIFQLKTHPDGFIYTPTSTNCDPINLIYNTTAYGQVTIQA